MNFKQLVLMNLQALTNFPYIEKDFDAVTDYELLCLVVDHLNEVIKNSNKQNTVIQNLYNAFVALKDYVDNYFDNLDVQEEIDNKLDKMAASGELSDIIAQYLKVASVLAFDTKASLKSADNLVNGSITRTLGESSYNDGKGSYYKIRTITSGDVVDDNNILALANFPTLIAKKIIDYDSNDPTNPCYYGADPTGTVDSASAINECIIANKGGSIKFTPGKYIVNSSINTPYFSEEQVNIDFSGSTLYTDEELDYVIGVGYYNYDDSVHSNHNVYTAGNYNTCAILQNFIINAPQSEVGIITRQYYYYPRFDNFSILNCNVGMQIGHINNGGESQDASITNGFIQCYDYKESSNIGIILNGHDSKIQNCRIYNGQIGILINGNANYIINSHIYLYGHLNERSTQEFATAFANTIGIKLNGNSNLFNSVYVDSYKIGFKSITNTIDDEFINCQYNSNVTGVQKICFDYHENTASSISRLNISNGNFNMANPGNDENIGLYLTATVLNNFNSLDNIMIKNNHTSWLNHDILSIKENGYQPFNYGTNVTFGNYYKIGYIPVITRRNCYVCLNGVDKLAIAKVYMNDNGISNVARIVGSSGSHNGIGFKNVEFNGVKYVEISASNQGASTFGASIEKDMTGFNIPFIPVMEAKSKYNITNYETTPDYSIDFS